MTVLGAKPPWRECKSSVVASGTYEVLNISSMIILFVNIMNKNYKGTANDTHKPMSLSLLVSQNAVFCTMGRKMLILAVA